jgi:hypothetical protein
VTTSVERGTASPEGQRCKRCESAEGDRYCTCCGNELGGPRDLSIKQFVKEAVVAVTDVDSALISTFRSLVTRPGELTAEYLSGDRSRFLAPFRLFLLCNLIYFVVAAQVGMGVLTVPLDVQMNQMTYQKVSRAMVDEHLHMQAPVATPEAAATRDSVKRIFTAKYDGATEGIGKVIVAVLIPLYAILIQILYTGRRRFFAEHLVLATHLTAFLLVTFAVIGIAASVVERATGAGARNEERLFTVVFVVAFSTYAYFAQRVVYQATRASAALRTVVLTASIAPILVVLKFVLFLVTLYWIG